MQHSFDIKLAEEIGIIPAILFNHIAFWIRKNEANEKHFYDGKYWTYSSVKGFKEYFPYLTENQIRRALETLAEKGLLIKGNYNSNPYDRTSWFALGDIAKSIWQGDKIELAKLPNGKGKIAKPIPDIRTDNKPDSYRDADEGYTLEQVLRTAKLPDVAISEEEARYFYDHYCKQGWVFGNGQPVKNLAAALRAWKKGNKQSRQGTNDNATFFKTTRQNRNKGTYNDPNYTENPDTPF